MVRRNIVATMLRLVSTSHPKLVLRALLIQPTSTRSIEYRLNYHPLGANQCSLPIFTTMTNWGFALHWKYSVELL